MKFRDLPDELKIMLVFGGIIGGVIITSIFAIIVGLVIIIQ